jgi:exodeoxyribonuclease V beta subunit
VRARAIAEMHVMLPLDSISPSSLSRALIDDPRIASDPERLAWAGEIAAWTFGTLAGYFQGYIDLIFEHREKFYVVDYKTNTLASYDQQSLERAMLQHNYLLQARLYTLALHRHLKATLAGYRPETHLGGCAYLFVRGFPERGVWFESFDVGSVRGLDRLFAEART